MEKIRKNIWLFLLCVIFFVALALAVLPSAPYATNAIAVSAEDPTDSNADNVPLFDKNYYFEEGAALNLNGESIKRMGFQFALQNLNYRHLIDGDKDRMVTVFTLYRENSSHSSNPIPLYQIGVLSMGHEKGVINLYFHKALNTDEGIAITSESSVELLQKSIDESSCDVVIYEDCEDELQQTAFNYYKDYLIERNGFELDYITIYKDFEKAEHLRFYEEDGIPYVRLALSVNSPKLEYFVECQYHYKDYSHTTERSVWYKPFQPILEDHYTVDTGVATLRSSTRSIYMVLNNMYEQGGESLMQTELGSFCAEGLAILRNCSLTTITVRYLVQIDNLPFARMVTSVVTVPVLTFNDDRQVYHDDICNALGIQSLSVLGASWSGQEPITIDGKEVWQAKYFEAVYLTARTTDGNTTDAGSQSSTKYFLDLNKSYAGYYRQFVEDEVFTQEAYEFFYNQLVISHPILAGVQPEELHGYWGFVGLPKTSSVNTAWADIFDIKTSMVGIYKSFNTDATLTQTAYDTLLKDYGYRWWERAWNSAVNFVNGAAEADLYFFCANAKSGDVGIMENGATDLNDDRGVAEIEITEAAEELLSGLPNLLQDAQAKFEKTMKIVLGVVAVVAIAGIGIFLYLKFGKKE